MVLLELSNGVKAKGLDVNMDMLIKIGNAKLIL